MTRMILTGLLAGLLAFGGQAQNVTTPPVSKKASVSEWIGLTEVSIDYHRPGVKDRPIWGALVPYDKGVPMPWRAGADENTVISFEHDVTINGKPLAAGHYGLHVIPSETEWIFIFSTNYTSWGSFSYNPAEDALRVTAVPTSGDQVEWLRYQFIDQTDESAKVELAWEKKRASFTVAVDVKAVTLNNIRNELRNTQGFTWQGYNSAAQYCLQNDVSLEEGLAWANRSISGGFGAQPTFSNYQTKSAILTKLGRTAEAEEAMAAALPLVTMTELHFYGRSLIQQEKPAEAMKIFEMNRERHPDDNFTTLVGMARGYMALGKNAEAIKYFRKAAPNAPPGQEQFYLDLAEQLEKG